MTTTAYCPDCDKHLPISKFYHNAAQGSRGYTSSYCKTHQREHDRRWREENREHFNAYMRDYQAKLREIKKRKEIEQMQGKTQEPTTEPEAEQIPMFAPKKRGACTCGNVRRCSECRRREQAKDEPTVSLSPDVLAICLEVRAQNSRKHQPAARAGGD
jgi:hypothetical protein